MSLILINIFSALAIAVVISIMSKLPSQRAKALLYSLPIPITIALISSGAVADSLHVTGLMLTGLFLWSCYYLHIKLRKNILLVDILLSVLYVCIGFVLAQYVRLPFELLVGIFLVIWIALMCIFHNMSFDYVSSKTKHANVWLKGSIIFAIACGLFAAKQYLAAFVVTFPYNGVFAVYENKAGLYPQAALFTRNSLALLAYFAANHYAGHHFGDIMRYVLSWLAFAVVLFMVNKFVRIHVKEIASK